MDNTCSICGKEKPKRQMVSIAVSHTYWMSSSPVCHECSETIDLEEQQMVKDAHRIIAKILSCTSIAAQKARESTSYGTSDIIDIDDEVAIAEEEMPAFPELYTKESWESYPLRGQDYIPNDPVSKTIERMLKNVRIYPAWYLLEVLMQDEIYLLEQYANDLR